MFFQKVLNEVCRINPPKAVKGREKEVTVDDKTTCQQASQGFKEEFCYFQKMERAHT